MNKVTIKGEVEGFPIIFETGTLAYKSLATVRTQLGETVVLTLVNVGEPLEEAGFLPLNIDYIEKLYAGGLISGARFLKREIRPTDEEIIRARLIDHAIRSLFPSDFTNQLQVVNIVLSYDGKNDPPLAALLGTSACLMISGLPFNGPIGAFKIGIKGDTPVFHLLDDEEAVSNLVMYLSATKRGITGMEVEAGELEEESFIQIMEEGFEKAKYLMELQEEFAKKVGVTPIPYVPGKKIKEATEEISGDCEKEIKGFIFSKKDSLEIQKELDNITEAMREKYEEKFSSVVISEAVKGIVKKLVRKEAMLGRRISGRALSEIRPIEMAVGVLPRTHGSAIFQRGLTQVLSTVTLGSTRFEQTLQSLAGEETRRFMHHYNMPGYASGEIDPKIYIPSRRSIGHGMIGEKALKRMVPQQDVFPYTIRVVSEVLSSDGSTSMASVCASTLALMDAGVQIKAHVGGISTGLIYNSEKEYALLIDISGIEDGCGDMDFKVAGTTNGITAIQLDNKIGGVPVFVLKDAISKSKEARLEIIEKMKEVIPAPRKTLSKYAPKISTIKINPSKIGDLIGPGGKVIKGIIEATGVEIDIQQDGTVAIASTDEKMRKEAEEMILNITEEPELGKEYDAKVERVESYGIFVSASKAIFGLVHISEIIDGFVPDIKKIFKVGDKVRVKLIGIDDKGRLTFTMKGVSGNDEFKKRIEELSSRTSRKGGRGSYRMPIGKSRFPRYKKGY